MVPASVPFVASVRPLGSVLVVVNVVVPMPPVCVKVSLNGTPGIPEVFAGAVTVMVWQLIVSE